MSRLGHMLSGGKHIAKILMLYPINNAWANYKPSGPSDLFNLMQSDFDYMTDLLLRLHYDFDYTDEDILADAEVVELGSLESSNARKINKLIVNSVVETCQLQMGMTELKTGSVWNTMPPHVHSRRMEAYFYFEVPENQAICHFMGQPQETRHIWLQNEEAVISPAWSIHAAAGTSNYIFIWGMGGENLDYGDMDAVKIQDIR